MLQEAVDSLYSGRGFHELRNVKIISKTSSILKKSDEHCFRCKDRRQVQACAHADSPGLRSTLILMLLPCTDHC